jgi:2-polyprenyl-3-methyl-5-hydroxy-6-metoxy-1,4-benzoquinol methylase
MGEFDYNAAYFDSKLSDWTAMSIGTISSRLLDTLTRESYPREGVAVDYGCGSGAYLPYLQQSLLEVVGMDIAPEAVAQASKKPYKCVCLITPKTAPLPERSAAIVFSTEVLEHIEDAEAAIRDFHRMLKADGLLILTTTLYFSSINVYLSTAIQQKHPLSKVAREVCHYLLGFLSSEKQRSFVREWCYLPLGGHFHGFRIGALKHLLSTAGFEVREAHPLYIFEPIGFSRYATLKSASQAFRFPRNLAVMAAVSAIAVCNTCLKGLGLGANNIYLVARKTRHATATHD